MGGVACRDTDMAAGLRADRHEDRVKAAGRFLGQ